MNIAVMKQLIWKDIYLSRKLIIAYLFGGVVATLLISLSGLDGRSMHSLAFIAMQVILVGFGAHLILSNVLREQMDGNVPLVMSLPVTARDVCWSKIIAGAAMFVPAWGLVGFIVVAMIDGMEGIPVAMIGFFMVLFTEILVGFFIVLGVAMVTASVAWAVSAAVACFWLNARSWSMYHVIVAPDDVIATASWSVDGEIWAPLGIQALIVLVTLLFVARRTQKKTEFV